MKGFKEFIKKINSDVAKLVTNQPQSDNEIAEWKEAIKDSGLKRRKAAWKAYEELFTPTKK